MSRRSDFVLSDIQMSGKCVLSGVNRMGTEDYLHLQYLSYPDVYLRWSRIRRFADLSLGVCGRLRLLERYTSIGKSTTIREQCSHLRQ